MDLITIFLVACSLAMDAFAVSVANGIAMDKIKISTILKFGVSFGFAQFIMPVIGFFLAMNFKTAIQDYDHWIAFVLLSIIGGKMIVEVLKQKENSEPKKSEISYKTLFFMAIATSIDALAVGVTFAFVSNGILFPAVMIGVVTFILSCFGIIIGKKIGGMFQKSAEILGGSMLIIIGIKTLIEHLTTA